MRPKPEKKKKKARARGVRALQSCSQREASPGAHVAQRCVPTMKSERMPLMAIVYSLGRVLGVAE
jgi:hypothetical protein